MVANASGMRVAAVSCISNMAAGIGGIRLGHEDVLSETQRATPQMTRLLDAFLKRLADEPRAGNAGGRSAVPEEAGAA